MKRSLWLGAGSLLLALLVLLVLLAVAPAVQAEPRRSGFEDMSPALRAMQQDDAQNPAFLWLQAGGQRFRQDCARCHTTDSLRGVATRYPAFDTVLGQPVTLSARINLCQTRHVGSAASPPESEALLGLEAFVARQSRGLLIAKPTDPRLASFVAQGERLYRLRMGQLDLSCAQCHDEQAGRRLGGSIIPQGHPTGYPIYRLEWQGLGSLQRRLRHCMSGVRAEPFAFGSAEFTALELYLMQRAAGLPLETPAVRP